LVQQRRFEQLQVLSSRSKSQVSHLHSSYHWKSSFSSQVSSTFYYGRTKYDLETVDVSRDTQSPEISSYILIKKTAELQTISKARTVISVHCKPT
jgi:hypothetical protein